YRAEPPYRNCYGGPRHSRGARLCIHQRSRSDQRKKVSRNGPPAFAEISFLAVGLIQVKAGSALLSKMHSERQQEFSMAATSQTSNSTKTGGQLVARALKAEGIKAVFALASGHSMDIFNGCIDEGIQIIGCRHEQAAAHAADAWTRLTGIPGCAVVTAGPGVTDAVTGVANAWRAQVPMLLIGGQGPLCQHLMGSLQAMDNVDMMRPITKFATTILETKRIPDILGMALREAYAGRPGPVYVETPMDLLFNEVDENEVINPRLYRTRGKVYGDFKLIDEAARLLSEAQCPAILAGSQVYHCRGVAELEELAGKLSCP